MAKGKHAAAVNAKLREENRQLSEALAKVQSELRSSEERIDEMRARLDKIEAGSHPAVVAERMRADAATRKLASATTEARGRCEEFARLLFETIWIDPDDGRAWFNGASQEDYEQMRKIGGEAAMRRIDELAGIRETRRMRRSRKHSQVTGGEWNGLLAPPGEIDMRRHQA